MERLQFESISSHELKGSAIFSSIQLPTRKSWNTQSLWSHPLNPHCCLRQTKITTGVILNQWCRQVSPFSFTLSPTHALFFMIWFFICTCECSELGGSILYNLYCERFSIFLYLVVKSTKLSKKWPTLKFTNRKINYVKIFLSTGTHGWILLENLCRRIRASVPRTIMVVHMVLTQGSPALGQLLFQSTETSHPIERLERNGAEFGQ